MAFTALGDDRRAFSYSKALSVLEKIPFRITSVDQIKGLPTIGKSLVDSVSTLMSLSNDTFYTPFVESCLMWLQWWQIQEILSTGKLSKLEHLKNDEKVLTHPQVLGMFVVSAPFW